MSLQSEYLAWRRKPAVGCVFARLVAGRPEDYDQIIEVEPSAGSPEQIAGRIARRIHRLVAEVAVSAGVILLPGLDTLEKIARMSLALRNEPHWSVTMTVLQNPPAGPMVAVHMARAISFEAESRPSEALVFGPFQEFPPTRQAPVTALEIFVGVPRSNDPKTGEPTTKANLAHMGLHLPSQKAFDTMWANSIKGRRRSLGEKDDSRAKAKIAFVIPSALADTLGCAP